MSDEEFINLKNFISSLAKETKDIYEQSKNLCNDISKVKYQVSLLQNEIKHLKSEVGSNEFKN